jgi:hypothetical protein
MVSAAKWLEPHGRAAVQVGAKRSPLCGRNVLPYVGEMFALMREKCSSLCVRSVLPYA